MSAEQQDQSPFAPGARVAITDGWDNWHEGFVEKVRKSGRFTLRGGNGQQWLLSEQLSCIGCTNLDGRFDGDGGYTYLCRRVSGLVLGSVNLVENDPPMEANRCHSSRYANGEQER